MPILDRYILRLTLWRLGTTLAIAMGALLLERMVRLLNLLATQHASPLAILQIFLNLIPHYLALALSAAFFVSILLTVQQLSQDSEMDAMRAAGIGLKRIARPLMVLAAVLTVLSALVIGWIQPYSYWTYRGILQALSHTTVFTALQSGTLVSDGEGMTLSVGDIEPDGKRMSQVFLREEDPEDGEMLTLTAEEAEILRDLGNDQPFIRLFKGTRIESRPDTPNPVVVVFDQFDVPLAEAFEPPPARPRGRNERELTLGELFEVQRNPRQGIRPAEVDAEIHGRIVRIGSILFLPLLAVPLGIVSRRQRRGSGLAIGGLILVGYHQILQVGEGFADDGSMSPWLSLEGPFLAFAVISIATFVIAARRPAPWRRFGRATRPVRLERRPA